MSNAAPTEAQIRAAVRSLAAGEADTEARLLEEFWVPSTHVRADIATVGDRLHAYEIKSHADSLRRLPAQIVGFNSLFDQCTVVVASKHVDGTLALVPPWWTVLTVDGPQLTVSVVREGGENPSVSLHAVVRLLWRNEAVDALRANGIEPDLVGGRARMWEQLLDCLDASAVRAATRRALLGRTDWRVRVGPAPAG